MTQKRKLENNFTSTLHILLVLHRWVGGAFQEMADGKTKIETLLKPDDLIPPLPTPGQTPSHVREERFPLLSFLCQRKTTRKMFGDLTVNSGI